MTNKFILFIVMLSCCTIHAQAGTGIFLQINNFTQSGVSIQQQSIKNWKPSHFTNSKIIPACSVGDKGKEQDVGFKSDNSHTYTETETDVLGDSEHSLNLLAVKRTVEFDAVRVRQAPHFFTQSPPSDQVIDKTPHQLTDINLNIVGHVTVVPLAT